MSDDGISCEAKSTKDENGYNANRPFGSIFRARQPCHGGRRLYSDNDTMGGRGTKKHKENSKKKAIITGRRKEKEIYGVMMLKCMGDDGEIWACKVSRRWNGDHLVMLPLRSTLALASLPPYSVPPREQRERPAGGFRGSHLILKKKPWGVLDSAKVYAL